ncbi:MAG: glycosyltransferase family 4 protein [Anaerolineae bacterium]|nr:glycosyltransferase family 4 protein [Anaerolineae bacterium]
MKVVLTIHHFPPNYSAGAEIYTFRLANWLIKHGYTVEVVCIESITHVGEQKLEYRHEIYEGVSVWRLYFNLAQSPDPFRSSFDNPTIGAWFDEFLRQVQPDLVHINSCYLLSVNTIAAVKRQALPLIVTLHDFWFVCPRITLLKPTDEVCTVPENMAECAWCLATEQRRFRLPEKMSGGVVGSLAQRLLALPFGSGLLGIQPSSAEIAYRRRLLLDALRQADLILAPSEFLRNTFVKQGIDPTKIVYSRYGLDTSHWLTLPEKNGAPSPEMQIGYIGQLSYHKGVHLLIEAFKRLDFSRRPARLKIYGAPEAFPKYVQQLRNMANGNSAIEFMGRFDNRRVAEILHQADVTVVPSIWYENSPIAIMEALTSGTPVVTTNLGGMPELVQHNINGLLFKVGDVNDLTCQLQRLLDEPELVARLANKAQPIRMIDDEMTQIDSFYQQVLLAYQSEAITG